MADQTHNVDASLHTDNFSTGAKILIDNDVPENLYDDPDGVPLSASVGASVPSATVPLRFDKYFMRCFLLRGVKGGICP